MPRWRNTIGAFIFAFAYGTTLPLNDYLSGAVMKDVLDYAEMPLLGLVVLVPVGIWMDRRARR